MAELCELPQIRGKLFFAHYPHPGLNMRAMCRHLKNGQAFMQQNVSVAKQTSLTSPSHPPIALPPLHTPPSPLHSPYFRGLPTGFFSASGADFHSPSPHTLRIFSSPTCPTPISLTVLARPAHRVLQRSRCRCLGKSPKQLPLLNR